VAETYISISRNMQNELIEAGISQAKIKLLPNGVDTKIFSPSGTRDDDTLLFVGRITFNKGLHVLLESLHHLKRKVHLFIIGSKWDARYFKRIQEQINNENQKGIHKITYLGEKDPSEMIKWYQKA
jgi:glycosyltransferase involved in cell wall biosynthesis